MKYKIFFLYICVLLNSIGFGIDATIWEPGYETFYRSSYNTTDTPIQTGTARRSSPILGSGLYKIPAALAETAFYNVGRKLPILDFGDGARYIFVRGVNDFYNNRNYVWAAKPDGLTIKGTPGSIPIGSRLNDWIENDGIDAIMQADGTLVKIIRDHQDINFQLLVGGSSALKCGPMWKRQEGRRSSSFDVELPLDSLVPEKDGPKTVILKFAIYNTVAVTKTFSITVNGEAAKITGTHTNGDGEKVITAEIPISYFLDNDNSLINPTTLSFSTAQSGSVYDFSEVYIHCQSTTEGYLLIDNPMTLEYDQNSVDQFVEERILIKVEPGFSGELKVKNANYAVDMTKMGYEQVLQISQDGAIHVEDSTEIRYFYFSKIVKDLTFSDEKVLREIDLSSYDYLAIAQENPNYFTRYDKDRPENDTVDAWDKRQDTVNDWMKNIYDSNLYNTCLTAVGSNEKTMSQVLTEEGHLPLIVKLENIVDVYGGGLVSPEPISSLMNQTTSYSINNLCLVGASSIDTRKHSQSGNSRPYYPQFLGIPGSLYFATQTGYIYTEDLYSRHGEVAVGRLLVYSDADLKAWIKKRIDFEPGDLINLVSGRDKGVDFGKEQEKNLGILPATLLRIGEDNLTRISDPEVMSSANLNDKWRLAIAVEEFSNPQDLNSKKVRDSTLSLYQGHGAIYSLSQGLAMNSPRLFQVGQELPLASNFMFMTCNSGIYFLNSYSSYKYSCLSTVLFNGITVTETSINDIGNNPDATKGAVNIIASVGLAGASWESKYSREVLTALRDNPDLTWGEAFNLKYSLTQGDTSRTYHFFGDPAMRVMKRNPRRVEVSQGQLFKDEMEVTHLDDRLKNLNVDYARVENSGIVNWMGSLQPLNEEFSGRVPLVGPINLSTIPNVTEFTEFKVRVTSTLDLGDAGTLPVFWAMSNKFKIDREAPRAGTFTYPMASENILDYNIDCKVQGVIDTLSPISYRFFLTSSTDSSKYAELETADPHCQFTIDNVPWLEQFQGTLMVECFAADIFGNGLNADGKAGQPVAAPRYFYYHKNDVDNKFDLTDSDNDGLPDAWEKYHFGDLKSFMGSDLNSEFGLTYREVYLSGKLPMNFTLKLKAGWNLISVPARLSDVPVERSRGEMRSTLDELKRRINTAFYFDAEHQQYKPLDLDSNISSSQGFWAFSSVDQAPFTFSGAKPHTNQTDYLSGWNLFGSNSHRLAPSSVDFSSVFEWDFGDYLELPSNSLIFPMKGYWIKNSTATTRSSN